MINLILVGYFTLFGVLCVLCGGILLRVLLWGREREREAYLESLRMPPIVLAERDRLLIAQARRAGLNSRREIRLYVAARLAGADDFQAYCEAKKITEHY